MRLNVCLYHLFDYNNSSRVVLLYSFVIDNCKSLALLQYVPYITNHYNPVVPSCGENQYYTACPFLTNCWSTLFPWCISAKMLPNRLIKGYGSFKHSALAPTSDSWRVAYVSDNESFDVLSSFKLLEFAFKRFNLNYQM